MLSAKIVKRQKQVTSL